MRTAGGHKEDKRRTCGQREKDTGFARARPEDSSRTTPGQLEDKKETAGGQRPDTRFKRPWPASSIRKNPNSKLLVETKNCKPTNN